MITESQKAKLLEENEGLLISLAKRFNLGMPSYDFEDLLQEARLAFLEYINMTDNLEDVYLSTNFIKKALHQYVVRNAPLSVPYNTYRLMNTEKRKELMHLGNCEDDQFGTTATIDDADANIFLRDFLGKLNHAQSQIVHLKQQGYKRREIAQITGETECQVKKKTQLIAKKLKRTLQQAA